MSDDTQVNVYVDDVLFGSFLIGLFSWFWMELRKGFLVLLF